MVPADAAEHDHGLPPVYVPDDRRFFSNHSALEARAGGDRNAPVDRSLFRGGRAAPALQEQLKREGVDVEVVLTDKYPNVAAFLRLAAEPGRRISFLEQSVDAADVPADLSGFRTLFTGFHHLPPELARRVLATPSPNARGLGCSRSTNAA